ncbi:MAG TPA: AAA family ATPase [Miltoncostaeaceae bacterium]|nr:AAA family ATPase [Miltoncostaeaceae bacterium]
MSGAPLPAEADGLPPEIAETHVSWVVMLGDRAYKLLKPVDLGFLDHRAREARARACRRETEVNRRFAPDVYLGVLDVVDEGGSLRDHLIEMRRMPARRRLTALLATDEAAERVAEVARAVAAIHAAAPRSPEISRAGEPQRVTANWRQGLAQIDEVAADLLPAGERRRVAELALGYLAGRGALLARRIDEGWVRDGHGDLLCDDVFCLDDGPRLLDCLAFDDRLRHSDVLADAAFLAMDIEAHGAQGLGRGLLETWSRELGESHPASLADHYVAYRAHVRAKVACLRRRQGGERAAAEARHLHALCLRYLERARVRLVLVGGAPGTGKSTVAAALAERTGWAVLRSDAARAPLLGPAEPLREPAGYGEGRYAPERRAEVYAALVEDAGRRLALGESVILDASWSAAAAREGAREVAASTCSELIEIRCSAPADVGRRRIAERAARGGDPSEATPAIARRLAADADPWPQASTLDTDRSLADTLADALARVA